MTNVNKILLIIFLSLFFILAGAAYIFRDKIQGLTDRQDMRNLLMAKVVSWDYEKSELWVTIVDKGTEKYKITVDPTSQLLIVATRFVDKNGRLKGEGSDVIKDEYDERWPKAFCPEDTVRLISEKTRIGEGTLDKQKLLKITIIQNEGPRTCK
jgi:hypothetical protein